ncbi:Transposable element Tcb2 transposase [Apostichopus japonicus]|uniref:Transposable element Tcb2 transposase n=1 Tax=Stichopus japonicus TaxID=307972 RepID=A0A2G8JPJ7_STIJA|nr:Transposable element Tcb2 transposase [Apostichopus japonicus]
MARLSLTLRREIVNLSRLGNSISKIRAILAEKGYVVDPKTVKNLLQKWETHGTIRDLPRRRPLPKFGPLHLRTMDKLIDANREITSIGIQRKLREENLTISTSSIRRVRQKKLNWVCTKPRYAQLIRRVNQTARLEYAIRCIENKETFANAIFTDECSVELDHTAKLQFRRKGEAPELIGRPKHPTKVHVWAGISVRGATDIVIFDGIMRSEFYCQELLQNGLLPFVRKAFPDGGYRFIQDNDPKHTSGFTKSFMVANQIPWWPTPAESPDLNPIEMLWHELKHCLRSELKPYTLDDLKRMITFFWKDRVTPEKCQKYIGHIQKVLPVVLEVEGKATGH